MSGRARQAVNLHPKQPVVIRGAQGIYRNRFGLVIAVTERGARVRVAMPGGAWRTHEFPASAIHSVEQGSHRQKDLHVYLPWNRPGGKLRVAQPRVPGGPTRMVLPLMARQYPAPRTSLPRPRPR